MLYEVLALGLPMEYIVFDTRCTAACLTKALTRCGLICNATLEPKTIVYFHGQR